MEAPSGQGIVNSLAQQLGLPVLLEDAAQQLIAYSPHYELMDRIRRDTIMRRSTAQDVIDYFRPYELGGRQEPFLVPGDPDQDILPRLCIPLRHHDATLGFAWVLLPEERVEPEHLAAAEEARVALTLTMLAESRVRAGETEAVANLVSSDPDLRTLGLTDVEARGTFGRGRSCTVLVCLGRGWQDPAVRTSFWSASWGQSPADQLRAVTGREGIAVVAGRAGGDAGREICERALERMLRAGRRAAGEPVDEDLVLGIGSPVDGPGEAHRSYQEARRAARAARSAGGPRIAAWEELGVDRLLTQMPYEVLADAVDPRLRRLVEEAPDLAETLERYLDEAGAIASVAEALHIHRTTLYHRLDRVGRYGLDLARGADRLAAHAGLRALRLLGAWPPPG